MAKRQIYMDNNATTPLHPEVKKAISRAMDVYGNASSMHIMGRQAKELIEQSRQVIAEYIGAQPEEMIFVGSGSEANNAVLNILSCTLVKCMHGSICKRTIVTTAIEHPCVLETARCIQDRGTQVYYLNVDEFGKIDKAQLRTLLAKGNVGLVSVMMANNEIGTIQDIKEIAKTCHEYKALVHTDAVQALGKIPVNVNELDVDYLSLSGHKVYGPKGIGALYVKKGTPFCSLIRGGHQERGRRAGTENTLGIVGFGKAVEMLSKEADDTGARLFTLKNKLKQGIKDLIPDVKFNGHPVDSLSGTLNVSFPGAEGEAILLYLDLEGIAVSTGSACASGSLDPSHVLLACGLEAEYAHGSIRFSIGRENTEQDVDHVLKILPPIIRKIRDMSTSYKGSTK